MSLRQGKDCFELLLFTLKFWIAYDMKINVPGTEYMSTVLS